MKKKSFLMMVASVAAGASLWAPAASARDQVNWSVTVGSPLYMAPPPPVVYSPPPRVVVYQQPVYVAPAPVVQYYGYAGPGWRERREWHHHHHYRR